jgi:hypothetical protein
MCASQTYRPPSGDTSALFETRGAQGGPGRGVLATATRWDALWGNVSDRGCGRMSGPKSLWPETAQQLVDDYTAALRAAKTLSPGERWGYTRWSARKVVIWHDLPVVRVSGEWHNQPTGLVVRAKYPVRLSDRDQVSRWPDGPYDTPGIFVGDDAEWAARIWAEWRDDLRHSRRCRKQVDPRPVPEYAVIYWKNKPMTAAAKLEFVALDPTGNVEICVAGNEKADEVWVNISVESDDTEQIRNAVDAELRRHGLCLTSDLRLQTDVCENDVITRGYVANVERI